MSEQERKAAIYSRKCELRQERRTRRQRRQMERLVRWSIPVALGIFMYGCFVVSVGVI